MSLGRFQKLNVEKYTFMTLIFCRLCIQLKKNEREKMCYQYEAHKVYFYHACVIYDGIGHMTSFCRDE